MFVETNATFLSASTYIDHALVVCDLTQIPAEGSGSVDVGQLVSLITIHCWYLGQVTDNQCVIKICRSRPIRRKK